MKPNSKLKLLMARIRRAEASKNSAKTRDILSADADETEEKQKQIEVIRRALSEENVVFVEHFNEDTHTFRMDFFPENGMRIRVSVDLKLEEKPRMCRITVIFPFLGDRDFCLPLSEKIVELNFNKRYGCLHYERFHQELSYRYCMLTNHQFHGDDFIDMLRAVVSSAVINCEELQHYASGRFTTEDRNSIICQCQKQIIDLSN